MREHRIKSVGDVVFFYNASTWVQLVETPQAGLVNVMFVPTYETIAIAMFEKTGFMRYRERGRWQVETGAAIVVPIPNDKLIECNPRSASEMGNIRRSLESSWEHIAASHDNAW